MKVKQETNDEADIDTVTVVPVQVSSSVSFSLSNAVPEGVVSSGEAMEMEMVKVKTEKIESSESNATNDSNDRNATNDSIRPDNIVSNNTLDNCDYSDDNGDGNSNNDDNDDFYKPPEPDYSRANQFAFRSLCQTFEKLWSLKRNNYSSKKGKISQHEKLAILLPQSIVTDYLKGGSPFPFLRLMVPDLDTVRPHLGMKENTIGKIWAEAIGLGRHSADWKKLEKFTDPIVVGSDACGDLSMVVYEVVSKRGLGMSSSASASASTSTSTSTSSAKSGSKKKKGITIKQMNDLLDELAGIKSQQSSGTGTGTRNGTSNTSTTSLHRKGGASTKKLSTMRVRWVQKLIALNISPIEHKWIVRIILSKLELGVGSDRIINYYHPWAEDLYAANKNIKTLCATLCDKDYVKWKKEQIELEKSAVDNHNRYVYSVFKILYIFKGANRCIVVCAAFIILILM